MHFIAKPKAIKLKLINSFTNRLCKTSYQHCFQEIFSVSGNLFDQLPFLNSISFIKSTVALRKYN